MMLVVNTIDTIRQLVTYTSESLCRTRTTPQVLVLLTVPLELRVPLDCYQPTKALQNARTLS